MYSSQRIGIIFITSSLFLLIKVPLLFFSEKKKFDSSPPILGIFDLQTNIFCLVSISKIYLEIKFIFSVRMYRNTTNKKAPTPAGIGASGTKRSYFPDFIRPHVVGSFPSVSIALNPVSYASTIEKAGKGNCCPPSGPPPMA